MIVPESQRMTCVSYIPLVWRDGKLTEPDSLQWVLDHSEALAKIAGCTWLPSPEESTAGRPCPLFVVRECTKVLDHLLRWSQGAPGEWFTLVFERDSTRYSVALTPNLEMSLARYLEDRPEIDEEALCGVKVVGFPLTFVSGVGGINTFNKVRPLLPESGVVAFVDIEHFDRSNPGALDYSNVTWLGVFPYHVREKVKNVTLDRPAEEASRENRNVH